jgi:hypothetical protein
MDCVFNEVNDGLGTLIFVTPTECGVVEPEIQQQLEQLSQNQSQQTQGNSGTTSLLLIRNQNPSSTNNQTPSSTPAPQSAASKDPIIPIVNDSASVPKASAVQPRQKHTPGWVMPTLIVTGLAVVGISLPVTAPQLMAGLRRYWYK